MCVSVGVYGDGVGCVCGRGCEGMIFVFAFVLFFFLFSFAFFSFCSFSVKDLFH